MKKQYYCITDIEQGGCLDGGSVKCRNRTISAMNDKNKKKTKHLLLLLGVLVLARLHRAVLLFSYVTVALHHTK